MFKLNSILLNSKFILPALLLWQLTSVYLMATGVWPAGLAWVNMGLIVLYILFVPAFDGLLLAVASIPFYIVLPQHYSDTLAMWRVVVGVLFLKTIFSVILEFLALQKYQESRLSNTGSRIARAGLVASGMTRLRSLVQDGWNHLFTYEKFAISLFILGVLSLVHAEYPRRGAMQLIFLLNAALLYPIVIWVIKSREQFMRLLKYGALSTGLIIAIGYIQFIATLFSNTYYFWQYWALRVASLFYGLPLAKVLQYSNSWVTVSGESKTLRMFSIMPSSHAFAMVCVFFLAFVFPLVFNNETIIRGREKMFHWYRKVLFVTVFACFALILSGTRGVWVGMLPALVITGWLYYRSSFKQLLAPVFATMLLVVILFTASPITDRGLAWVRTAGQGTLDRVASIVDPNETSNVGRLAMWKSASFYALYHPLGVGYGNFVVALNPESNNVSFEEVASQDNDLYNLPQRYVTAHSLYLQVLVELSVLGLILFGLFWLAYYFETWKYLSGSSPREGRLGEVVESYNNNTRGNAITKGAITSPKPSLSRCNIGTSPQEGERKNALRSVLCSRAEAQMRPTPETVYIATASIIFLWFLAYSVFDLTWLNDKILLYTFIALGLVRALLALDIPYKIDTTDNIDKQ